MHHFDEIKSRKRKLNDGDLIPATPKRSRSERDIIVIDDEEDEIPFHFSLEDSREGLKEVYKQSLAFARVKSSSLSKNKYQVLYFPLSPPLSSEDMQSRHVVTSQRI